MEAEAEAIFAEIERAGGVIRAIEGGYFRRRIADSAFRFQSEVDGSRKLIVGVNAFVEPDASTIPTLEIDNEIERRQKSNLAQIKATRDKASVEEALGRGPANGRNDRKHHAGLAPCRRPARHARRDRDRSGRCVRPISAGRVSRGRPRGVGPLVVDSKRALWHILSY